jgi:hypothetical protein
VCRVLDGPSGDGATAAPGNAARRSDAHRGLRDAIAQIVFGVTAERDASERLATETRDARRWRGARGSTTSIWNPAPVAAGA